MLDLHAADTGPRAEIPIAHKYLDDHPESLSANFGTVVAAAPAQPFPCH